MDKHNKWEQNLNHKLNRDKISASIGPTKVKHNNKLHKIIHNNDNH